MMCAGCTVFTARRCCRCACPDYAMLIHVCFVLHCRLRKQPESRTASGFYAPGARAARWAERREGGLWQAGTTGRRGGVDRQPIQHFYKSRQWQHCRDAYFASHGGLCERCLAKGLIIPGEEVHHKIRLTPANLDDPTVTLNWDNLELLCKDCHLEEHAAPNRRRYTVAENGEVIIRG